MNTVISGKCSPEFSKVETLFRKLFQTGWEYAGASIAVYFRNELVVDLYGGYSDIDSLTEWTDQTRTVVFSVSKGVAALVMAMLVERGHLNYSDKVSKFWPEFSQNGKQDITVEWVMNHRAGLAAIDEPITLEVAEDPEKLAKLFEMQKPNWEPGKRTGYHVHTFGWLVDLIVRRADPKKRGISQFVKEEIAEKFGVDFHLGLPQELAHTVSRLSIPSWSYKLHELIYDPRIFVIFGLLYLRMPGSLADRIAKNPDWLKADKNCCTFNNHRILRLEHAGALGVSRAKDLAKMFALMLSGKLISKELLAQFSEPQIISERDAVMNVPIVKGHGFMYQKHPRKPNKWLFGHPGFGGSSVVIDPEDELVISYVTNGLKVGAGELTRTNRLLKNAVLECVEAILSVQYI